MLINTSQMLAPLSLNMKQQKELLAAEQPELNLLRDHAENVRLECSPSTCIKNMGRYERIHGLASGGKTLEERRAALLLYINTELRITPRYMEELLGSLLGCKVSLDEHYKDYYFIANIDGKGERSPNFALAREYVQLLKPAHIEAGLRYRQTISGYTASRVYAGLGLFLKVSPYQAEDLQAEVKIKTAVFIKQGMTLTIRPK